MTPNVAITTPKKMTKKAENEKKIVMTIRSTQNYMSIIEKSAR